MLIKNFNVLNKSTQRKICLELIETALSSIQPENVIPKNFSLSENILKIQDKIINLKNFERVFLLGFGKGSAGLSKQIEKLLGNRITSGLVIDLELQSSRSVGTKIEFTQGSHPLPSQENFAFTQKVIRKFSNLTIKD